MTREELEDRRLAAQKDIEAGMRSSALGRKYGVARTTAGRWKLKLKHKGTLAATKSTGRPSSLTESQFECLRLMLSQPARRWIYGAKDKWTCSVLRDAIYNEFGVRFGVDHVSRIAKRLGFPFGRPIRPRTFLLNEQHEIHG